MINLRNMNKTNDLSKLCIHTITNKPWDLETAVEKYTSAGVTGITVWRNVLEGQDAFKAGELIRSSGLEIVSLCRGGFFPASDDKGLQAAIDENKQVIDQAASLGAPMIVLVCGAVPGQPLSKSREQIRNGIEMVLPHAEANHVKLAIEPLHPMYADDRSAINTMEQANDMAESIGSDYVGVAVDVYHLWWDQHLEKEIYRCGSSGNLFAFHICDWKTPTKDLLTDRGIMGEGCINVPEIRNWVEKSGFNGFNEVEIFSEQHWNSNQDQYLDKIINGYLEYS